MVPSSGGSVMKDLPARRIYASGSPNGEFTKETDIMDVWFDSGSSWNGVVVNRPELKYPADLYLEGSDQYRLVQLISYHICGESWCRTIQTNLVSRFCFDGKGEDV